MYSVIILCAGKGTRTGLDYNKMLYEFDGKTVYELTLENFISDSNCGQIIVVTQPFERKLFEKLSHDSRIEFADGGQERQDSVYEGLKKLKCEYVLVHDGARPFMKKKYIDALLECLQVHSACLLMVPCKDTIKRVINGKIVETLKRSELMQAQTPQAFHREVIVNAYSKGILEEYQATDDAEMVEKFSDVKVYAIVSDYENIKITTPEDLRDI